MVRPWLSTGVLLALLVAGPAATAGAQLLRVEDETGTVHYTNTPCAPLYRHLAPGQCRPPEPEPAVTPAPGAAAPAEDTALPYARQIAQAAARYGIDRRLVQAVVRVESGGNPRAVSPKGAGGLMQLMPARAVALGVRDVFDPGANLDGGVRHLRELLVRYDGDVALALAAYNAGEEAVRLHGGIPPYRETQEYVQKVLALYAAPADPAMPAAVTRPGPAPGRPASRSRL